MIRSIDINCDLGESTNPEDWARDAEIMPYISSCNIACGGHEGNQASVNASIKNAMSHNLAIGAHPSYPDKENFGRKSMSLSDHNLRKTLQQQIALVTDSCNRHGIKLNHVKPHGALYNDAAVNESLAMIFAEVVAQVSGNIKLMGLADSAMKEAANKVGIDFINEGFMDRNYQENKTLVSRTESEALHSTLEESLQQALNFAQGKPIYTPSGQLLSIKVDSICLHGDNPDAVSIAKQLQQRLKDNQIQVRSGI
ncbi:5-oxoprolinase subunit PxpA [Kangiella japonica]|uniref:5-oxoprolinase subunit PxpA n=1 Tax=Kangiella japonica TaxID=647384 RepID=A0ABN0SUW2_9GAMM